MYMKKLTVLLFAILITLGAYLGISQLRGNFHTVVEGELYRSGQLNDVQMAKYQRKYNIKTIINLRGDNHGKKWYDDEIQTSKQLGINHINFRMSEKREFTKVQVEELVEIYKHAPKPILIHCRAGSDRTGLAAAVYIAKLSNEGEDEAEDQLSIYYGHVSLPWASKHKMDFSWEALEPLLGYYDS